MKVRISCENAGEFELHKMPLHKCFYKYCDNTTLSATLAQLLKVNEYKKVNNS